MSRINLASSSLVSSRDRTVHRGRLHTHRKCYSSSCSVLQALSSEQPQVASHGLQDPGRPQAIRDHHLQYARPSLGNILWHAPLPFCNLSWSQTSWVSRLVPCHQVQSQTMHACMHWSAVNAVTPGRPHMSIMVSLCHDVASLWCSCRPADDGSYAVFRRNPIAHTIACHWVLFLVPRCIFLLVRSPRRTH